MTSFDPFGYQRIERALDRNTNALNALSTQLTKRIDLMAGELDALKASVSRNNDVVQSAITLIQGIKAALDAAIAAGDPAALKALSDSLGSQDDALAAAVTANTPAAP
jgi:hypothetical protein